ncbi:MAG TPA: hypothetical protein VJV79_33155 [Polyangiaceae bacterium]|nr:hypothetical protein [Polyangiaceae bacterium]
MQEGIRKADAALTAALAASSDAALTVLLRLQPVRSDEPIRPDEPQKPTFGTRREMREALIGAQEQRALRAFGPIVSDLRALGLRVSGGDFSALAVVTGPPQLIRQALELEGVTTAVLDAEIQLA